MEPHGNPRANYRRRRRRRVNKKKRARIIRAYILNLLLLLFCIGIIVFVIKGIAGIFKGTSSDTASVSENEADTAETFVEIDRDHSLKVTVDESFEKGIYREEELKASVEEEIEEFSATASSEEPVKLKSVNVSKGRAKLVMEYDSDSSYRLFNGEELYVCPVTDFPKYGIDADATFINAKDKSPLLSFRKDEINPYMAAVTDEKAELKVPGKIVYYSDNVSPSGTRTALCPGGRSFIIYKKVLFEKKE